MQSLKTCFKQFAPASCWRTETLVGVCQKTPLLQVSKSSVMSDGDALLDTGALATPRLTTATRKLFEMSIRRL